MTVLAVEYPEGEVLAVGYDSRGSAREDASNYDGARVRSFSDVQALKDAFPDEGWLDTLPEDEVNDANGAGG